MNKAPIKQDFPSALRNRETPRLSRETSTTSNKEALRKAKSTRESQEVEFKNLADLQVSKLQPSPRMEKLKQVFISECKILNFNRLMKILTKKRLNKKNSSKIENCCQLGRRNRQSKFYHKVLFVLQNPIIW